MTSYQRKGLTVGMNLFQKGRSIWKDDFWVCFFTKQLSKFKNLGGSDSKDSACSVGDLGLIPGLGRSPGEGNGYLLQYSCLENYMDRGAWRATVHRVTKSWTWLSIFHLQVLEGSSRKMESRKHQESISPHRQ